MKTYQSSDIQKMFDKLSNPQKVSILYEALDHMQSYNGRSKTKCIAIAMGYKDDGLGQYVKK